MNKYRLVKYADGSASIRYYWLGLVPIGWVDYRDGFVWIGGDWQRLKYCTAPLDEVQKFYLKLVTL